MHRIFVNLLPWGQEYFQLLTVKDTDFEKIRKRDVLKGGKPRTQLHDNQRLIVYHDTSSAHYFKFLVDSFVEPK